jgi:hypothetical protein
MSNRRDHREYTKILEIYNYELAKLRIKPTIVKLGKIRNSNFRAIVFAKT